MLNFHAPHTMWTAGCHSTLDYIFYNPRSMQVVKLLETPPIDELASEKDLPNKLFPSDHVYIMTEFKVFSMKKEQEPKL